MYPELLVFWGENTRFSFWCFLPYSTGNSVERGAVRAMPASPVAERRVTAKRNCPSAINPDEFRVIPASLPAFLQMKGDSSAELWLCVTSAQAALQRSGGEPSRRGLPDQGRMWDDQGRTWDIQEKLGAPQVTFTASWGTQCLVLLVTGVKIQEQQNRDLTKVSRVILFC